MEKAARYIYLVAVCLFIVGVTVQVYLAGMVVVANRMVWESHISLGHMLAGPLLIMLVSQYPGRMPGPLKRLTWLLFAVYVLQADVIIFLRRAAPEVSALHPVLALVDYALALALARRAWSLVGQRQAAAPAVPDLGTTRTPLQG